MMKVLIIEDEKPASQKLTRLLKKISSDIEVIDVLTSVEHSINWFVRNPEPELIFMDIQLDDGICFEIFESRNIQTPVIFTTAYDEYTLKAFKINSIDYLLKPIDSEELENALEKFRTLHKPTNYHTLESIMKKLQSNTKERFLVKIGEHYLVDGSVTNNTPISVAAAKGADRIMVFPTGMSCGLKQPPKRLIEMAMQTLNLATSHRLIVDIENYSKDYDIIVVPPLCPLDVSIFNFSRAQEMIDRAENNTRRWLSDGGLEGKADSMAVLRPHFH